MCKARSGVFEEVKIQGKKNINSCGSLGEPKADAVPLPV